MGHMSEDRTKQRVASTVWWPKWEQELSESPGQILRQLSAIDFMLHSDNINFHMCHMRMSLKAQTHFHTIRNVWVITPHGATQPFGMLILHAYAPTPPPDETPTLPPISTLTTPYASAPPPHLLRGLQSLRCCGALKLCHRRRPHPPYASLHPPNMPLTLLIILTLAVPSQHAFNTTYHPYAHIVPA
ncbi:hypothetical protein O181_082269 [Austropuccinia psidii MF-1]|uniref:Uncharacterized protein n=1 Tax=Austropuccinia psidii MF-1 TaxID=1389203 RepID=A0A9Q3FPD4_9BASI|nr:hypothetical protein [Austropuccinia psidii MF-1]